jgi:hypothetical protein
MGCGTHSWRALLQINPEEGLRSVSQKYLLVRATERTSPGEQVYMRISAKSSKGSRISVHVLGGSEICTTVGVAVDLWRFALPFCLSFLGMAATGSTTLAAGSSILFNAIWVLAPFNGELVNPIIWRFYSHNYVLLSGLVLVATNRLEKLEVELKQVL